jgi:hypothetical protein
MDTNLDSTARAARAELEAKLPKEVAVDFEALFPKLTGWGVAKRNRLRAELLARLAPVLRAALKPSEKVLLMSQGIVNLWWEQMFMGAWAGLINRTALVLTNERLLLVHLSGKEPESFVNQVPRAAFKKVKAGLFSLVLKLGKGQIVLSGVPGAEKKTLRDALPVNQQAQGGLEYLCSTCFAMHTTHVEVCSRCGVQFKSPRTEALRSLLLPGLGDFYLGHRSLAVMEMMGSLVTWAVVIALIAGSAGKLDVILLAVVILALANGTDGAVTHAQGKKGLMSLDGKLAGPQPGRLGA